MIALITNNNILLLNNDRNKKEMNTVQKKAQFCLFVYSISVLCDFPPSLEEF